MPFTLPRSLDRGDVADGHHLTVMTAHTRASLHFISAARPIEISPGSKRPKRDMSPMADEQLSVRGGRVDCGGRGGASSPPGWICLIAGHGFGQRDPWVATDISAAPT